MTKIRSMTDVAYEVMSKKKRAIPFKKLWMEVIEKLELDPEKASDRTIFQQAANPSGPSGS